MNVRAPGIAIWRGVIEPFFKILWSSSLKFMQIPCPETPYLGLRRWWFVKEQYDNALYRRMCRTLASCIAETLENEGVRRVKLVGLGLSPSCAYRETQSDPKWGGRPREIDTSANVKIGMGVWSEELLRSLEGFQLSFYDLPPPLIYPKGRTAGTTLYPKTLEESITEMAQVFNVDPAKLIVDESKSDVHIDMRSGRCLVAPIELALQRNGRMLDFVNEGYGLILIPDLKSSEELCSFYLNTLADQIENQIKAGQLIIYVNHKPVFSKSYERLLRMIVERGIILEQVVSI